VYKQSFSCKINCREVKYAATKQHISPDKTDRARSRSFLQRRDSDCTPLQTTLLKSIETYTARVDSRLIRTVLYATVKCKDNRGRRPTIWIDSIINWTRLNFVEVQKLMQDKHLWKELTDCPSPTVYRPRDEGKEREGWD